MADWQFCFLSDQYYIDFPDENLMKNKEVISGQSFDRPCFFAFQDTQSKDILWLIPISSKYDKYKKVYDKSVSRYGFCTTIRFGKVLGTQAAFLIQNMCPATEKYIREIYVDKNNTPINIDNRIVQDVVVNAKDVLGRVNRGARLIFPNVMGIKKALLLQLDSAKAEREAVPAKDSAQTSAE